MFKLFFILSLTTSFLFSNTSKENKIIEISQLSPKELSNTSLAEYSEKSNLDHLTTILWIKEVPKDGKIFLKMKRPLFNTDKFEEKGSFEVKKLVELAKLTGAVYPFLAISSQGFLPGESVVYHVSNSSAQLSETITIIPNPLPEIEFSTNRYISVELKSVNPVIYTVEFDGFVENEPITMKSVSKNEELSHQIKMPANFMITMMPGVLGHDGGICYFTIKQDNHPQDSYTWKLPWGKEFIPYLQGLKRFEEE